MQVLRMDAGHLIFNYLGISFENAPFDRLLGFRVSVRDVHWREIRWTPRPGRDGTSRIGPDAVDGEAAVNHFLLPWLRRLLGRGR